MSSTDDPADAAALAGHSARLADAVDRSVVPWLRRIALARCADEGIDVDDVRRGELDDITERCGRAAADEVRRLLAADIDAQSVTPLEVLRRATRPLSGLLDDWQVPPAPRDEFDRRAFPDDRHGLVPASFADIDDSLTEPGLVWGAAKAHVHLARRRAEGLR